MNRSIENLNTEIRVHVPRLLNEIQNNAIATTDMQALRIPFGTFRHFLNDVAIRCSEINDPILNALMCQMALYQIANPDDEGYDLEETKKVMMLAQSIVATLKAGEGENA